MVDVATYTPLYSKSEDRYDSCRFTGKQVGGSFKSRIEYPYSL